MGLMKNFFLFCVPVGLSDRKKIFRDCQVVFGSENHSTYN